MPSQLFDDGYGVYEVPSGERLIFKGGEGADASYNLPSAFDKCKASPDRRGRTSAMGSSDRFNSPGSYLANAGAPGPGAYSYQASPKPSSRYGVLGPEARGGDRLKFEGAGEGADAVYTSKSVFEGGSPTKGGAAGLGGTSQRFGKVNSHLSKAYTEAPGPGAYTSSPALTGAIHSVQKKAPPPPQNTGDRLSFVPLSGMGESPGPVYKIESTFDKSAEHRMRSSGTGFGKSDRFNSPGSYLKKGEAPGPGSYSTSDLNKGTLTRPSSAPHGGRQSFRSRSVDFGPAGEGADPAYQVQSAFDKAAARGSKPSSSFGTTSRFDKHGSYAAKASSSEPGPGTYTSPHKSIEASKSFAARPNPPPHNPSKGRVDFGPQGEGVAAMYEIKSSFDTQAAASKRGPTSCFGSSKRFEGAGSYTNPSASPGPGAYNSRAEVLKRSAPKATFASPRMRPPGWSNRPRSASVMGSPSNNSYLR